MATTIWGRLQELKDSISSDVQPQDRVTLNTQTVKNSLGIYLLQSILIATVWALKDNTAVVWIIPISAFLQIGWVWNKVKESWKNSGDYAPLNGIEIGNSISPPELVIQTAPLTQQESLVELHINDDGGENLES